MENSPLRFLKDNDIITIINEEVPKSRKKMDIKYHMNRYNNKEYNLSKKYFEEMNKVFKYMTIIRNNNIRVSFIQPIFPFHCNVQTNILNVKYSIKRYEDFKDFI
tara:strand:+ start:427 stop:741 length:315 start_codon:yes stop_codon:yes gene_type:complete